MPSVRRAANTVRYSCKPSKLEQLVRNEQHVTDSSRPAPLSRFQHLHAALAHCQHPTPPGSVCSSSPAKGVWLEAVALSTAPP